MEKFYNVQLQDYIISNGSPAWVVCDVHPQRNYTLLLTFASGEKRIYNALPLLEKEIYAPLKNLNFFTVSSCSLNRKVFGTYHKVLMNY